MSAELTHLRPGWAGWAHLEAGTSQASRCLTGGSARGHLPCVVAGELGADELLQLAVGGLDRIADTVGDALRSAGAQRIQYQRDRVHRTSPLKSVTPNQDATSELQRRPC
jgi:hypothetical protein